MSAGVNNLYTKWSDPENIDLAFEISCASIMERDKL
jgi:hypothetical protein